MKKFVLLASLMLVATAVAAIPSLAQQQGPFRPIDDALIKPGSCANFPGQVFLRQDVIDLFGEEALEEVLPGNNPFFCVIFDEELFPEELPPEVVDRDRDEVADVVPAFEIDQETEQEAESGDVNQSFNVSNTGDNSNQCAGIQGVANTGNAQNQISLIQSGSEADEFSIEDSGASITVSPSNTTTCDQQVNQAASAFGG